VNAPPRVLVAGIGNVFLGDDAFGSEAARRLAAGPLPAHVTVVDYGIRGMHLAFDLVDGYDALVLLDAMPRGGAPGTLYVIEPELDPGVVALDTHGMDPVKVLATARALGGTPPPTIVIGCEVENVDEGMGLSEPVAAAVPLAVAAIENVVADLAGAISTPSEG